LDWIFANSFCVPTIVWEPSPTSIAFHHIKTSHKDMEGFPPSSQESLLNCSPLPISRCRRWVVMGNGLGIGNRVRGQIEIRHKRRVYGEGFPLGPLFPFLARLGVKKAELERKEKGKSHFPWSMTEHYWKIIDPGQY
jgi:hypothetical protein